MKTFRRSGAWLAVVSSIVAPVLIVVAVAPAAGARPLEGGAGKTMPGPGEQVLSGSIVAVDEEGNELHRESGRVSFLSRTTDEHKWIKVPISEGTYEAIVPMGANIEVRAFVLDGCPAVADEREFVVPASGVRDIRARKLKPLVLRVTGEEAGDTLSPIEIRASQGHYENATPEGAEYVETLRVDATSPVNLEAGTHLQMYWLRAPGYAWKRILLGDAAGGEHVVELRKAGSLAVSLEGAEVPEGTRIRLFGGHSPPFVPDSDVAANREGRTEIQSLLPGTYSVVVEVGDERSATRLGEAKATIVAGKEASVKVSIETSPLSIPLVPFRGTILLPQSSIGEDFSLWIMSQERRAARGQDDIYLKRDRMTSTPDRPDVLSWDAGDVVPGRYLISGLGIEHRELVDVGSEGLVDHEIVIPETARVVLRIRDKATGECVQPNEVSWSDGADIRAQKSLHRLSVTPDTGAFEFDAPSGRIEITVNDPCFLIGRELVDLHPGPNEVEIQAKRACGLYVSIDGAVEADHRLSSSLRVRVFKDGIPVIGAWNRSSREWSEFAFEEPGKYEVRVPPLPGFEPVPPQTVTLELGQLTEMRIELRKSR